MENVSIWWRHHAYEMHDRPSDNTTHANCIVMHDTISFYVNIGWSRWRMPLLHVAEHVIMVTQCGERILNIDTYIPVTSGFPSQRASNVEIVSMFWDHPELYGGKGKSWPSNWHSEPVIRRVSFRSTNFVRDTSCDVWVWGSDIAIDIWL